MMTIMIGKMEMVLPDMYMMKRFIGTCQIKKSKLKYNSCLQVYLSIIGHVSAY
jgi:hypothetical protein